MKLRIRKCVGKKRLLQLQLRIVDNKKRTYVPV
jgi:hypothetical protein